MPGADPGNKAVSFCPMEGQGATRLALKKPLITMVRCMDVPGKKR